MKTRFKTITILVLVSFLYSNILWAVDTQVYKLANRSNVQKLNEECLPLVENLIRAVKNGKVKEDDLPEDLRSLWDKIPKNRIIYEEDKVNLPLTPEEIAVIEGYINGKGVSLLRDLLVRLLPVDEDAEGEEEWVKKLVPELKKFAEFFPDQTDREIITFLKGVVGIRDVSGLLDLCLSQLLRPNSKTPNLNINLSQCVLEIEDLLKALQHLPYPEIKRILGKAIDIAQKIGKKAREGDSLEKWRKDKDVREALVRFFKRIKKADIHHHLDGGISPYVALRVIWEYPKLRELFVRNILGEKEGDPDEIFRSRIGGLDDPKSVERLKPFIEYNYKGEGEIDWDAFFGKFSLFYHILNTNLDAVSFVAKEASLEDYYNDAISLVEHKISIITPGLELDPAKVLEALVKGLIEAERDTNGRLKTGLIPCIWKTPHFILDRRYREVVKMAEDDERSLEDVKRDILKELPDGEYDEFEEMCREVERQVRRDTKEDIEKNIKQRIIILYEARKEALRQAQLVVNLKKRWEREKPEYASYLIGLDTVGDEKDYIRWVTAPALRFASQNGFRITEHLGENWHPGELKYALLRIKQGVESGVLKRIGHATALGIDTSKLAGVYTEEEIREISALQEEIKRLIKERTIHIETNPSSNVLMVPEKKLRLIARYRDHPLRRFYEELQDVSINTDDSWILHTVGLSGEFAKIWLANPDLRFDDLLRIIDNGFKNSFLRGVIPEEVKNLSGYHPSSIINGVKDFGEQIPVLDYQGIGDYPEELVTLEKSLTVYAAGWEKARAGEYGTLVAPAGMPAINMMVDSAIERKGLGLDAEIIVIEPPYGCTKNLFENWQRRGVLVHSVSVDEVKEKLPGLINDKTAIIYGESVTNPNLRLLDIEAVLRINRGRAAVLIDDTFATPEMIRSLDVEVEVGGKKYSVDMVMLGLTKGMTGTGNIISGAVVAKKEWLDLLARQRNCLPEHAEITRAIRGLRHLEIRFKAQSRDAKELISHLAGNGLISDTVYPGNGHMIYFIYKRLCNAIDNINLLSKFRTLINAVSLGQVRNLFERPSGGTHFTVAEEAREKGGISPAGIRGSIGIENIQDVLREFEAMLEILSLYGDEIPKGDISDINKIFMAEHVTQEEGKRTVRYLLPKWPIPNANLKRFIADLFSAGKGEGIFWRMIKAITGALIFIKIWIKYNTNKKFRKAVDIILNATEITRYDPVTIAIHHRLLWCLLSGDHNSVIASPTESTTTHKQDDMDMQKTFASILEGKKKGFPPDVCFRLYSRFGRPGIVTFELLMTLLEVGVEKALNYDYIGTSFYSERMAHKTFLEQQAEIVMMNEIAKRYERNAQELEGLRQKDPIEYHKMQMEVCKGLDKEIIIVTQPGSPLFKEAMRLAQHDAVRFRVITPGEVSDIEKVVSDKTVLVYFDSMRFSGVDPVKIRDIVKKSNPDCVFGITDSFNFGYENPRETRDFDFVTHVIYYEDSDYGAVIIAKNDKPLTQVWNNPYWSRKNRGVAMSEDIATMAMWYILPYLRVFDERYEENLNAVSGVLKGVAGLKRVDKRHIEISFTKEGDKERFLAIAKSSNLIDTSSGMVDEYFFINEWTSIRPHAKNPNTLILRIGIENTEDIVKEFGRMVSRFREDGSGAIGKGSSLAEKDNIKTKELDAVKTAMVKQAIDEIRDKISVLTGAEKDQATQALKLLEEYFARGAIVSFDALVKDPEDYLLAFPRARDHIIALIDEFFLPDFPIPLSQFLSEVLFHEGYTAVFGEADYEAHKSVYLGIQRRIFGRKNELKGYLRRYINSKIKSFKQWGGDVEKAKEYIRDAVKREKPLLFGECERFSELSEEQKELVRRGFYKIGPGHFQVWGLRTALNRQQVPEFEGSHIVALVKSFPELGLNPLGFRLGWETKEDGIRSVHYVFEREAPFLYTDYLNIDNLNEFRKQILRDKFYQITDAHFRVWRLPGALDKRVAPYFGGSIITVLNKSFPKLGLDPMGFGLKWETKDEGMESVRYVFEREVPHLYRRYLNIKNLTSEEVERLKEEFLKITKGHFSLWGLGGAMMQNIAPYFGGSYKVAICICFPELELCPEDFDEYRRAHFEKKFSWATEDEGISNVREVIRRERPGLYGGYGHLDILNDQDIEALREGFYKITNAHFIVWGLGGALNKRCAPYFEGSHITALIKSFPELKLDPRGFVFSWDNEEEGIGNIRFVISRERPLLYEQYLKINSLTEVQKELLRAQFYEITAGHFGIWGLRKARDMKRAPYFNGSHIVALMKSFPDLGLDPLGFKLNWDSLDDGIRSVQYVIKRERPLLYERYNNLGSLSEEEKEELRGEFYEIDSGYFNLWGLGQAMDSRKVPYFNGSYMDALIISFSELGLQREGFTKKGKVVSTRLVQACRADNGSVDAGDLRVLERVAGEVDKAQVPEGEKPELTAQLATARLTHRARGLEKAKAKIKEQIDQYATLKGRIGRDDGKVKNVLIDKECLPENQRYILEGDEWAKRKQLLEKLLFPGYRFSVFTGVFEEGMDENNTIVLTNKDTKLDARLVCITNAGEDEYFPIDGLIFLGIGLLNLSRGDTPLASTVQNLYKELTGNYMDIDVFLKTRRLNIKLQPIAKFDTELEIYAITLLEQAA